MNRMTPLLSVLVIMVVCVFSLAIYVQGADAAVPTPGNILVAYGTNIWEYTLDGQLVQTIDVPSPGGDAVGLRDITMDSQGRIFAYNGTYSPYLSTYTSSTDTWTASTLSGWSTVNNVTYGGLTSYQNYVYATDMITSGTGSSSGIVRFDINSGSAQRYYNGANYIDITLGLDGYLYTLYSGQQTGGREVYKFDPITMENLGCVYFPNEITSNTSGARALAVAENGDIYLAMWDGPLYRTSSTGEVLQASTSPMNSSYDIEINSDGLIMVTRGDGVVTFTDTSFSSFRAINTGGTFATFVPVPEPASVVAVAFGVLGLIGIKRKR